MGNNYQSPGNVEIPIQDEPQKEHTKTRCN